MKIFLSSSASSTLLTAEETSGFAKRVRQDNSSDKLLQENGPAVGMSELLLWYLITWLPNTGAIHYIFIVFSQESPFIYSSPLLHGKCDYPCHR